VGFPIGPAVSEWETPISKSSPVNGSHAKHVREPGGGGGVFLSRTYDRG
jgi:hypothetical protein